MKSVRLFLCVILAVVLFSGCKKRYPSGLAGLKWEHIDYFSDSITSLLENRFYEACQADSILVLTDSLIRHADGLPQPYRHRILARGHFWKARLFEREGDIPEAIYHVSRAIELCDSASTPYTYRRIKIISDDLSPQPGDNVIRRQIDDLEYFRSLDDRPMEAATCILIGNTLSDSYQPEQALQYFYTADSISSSLGLVLWTRKNKINISDCLYREGDSVKADKLQRELLEDSIVRKDFHTYNVVLRNASLHFGDPKYVVEAYRRTLEMDSTSPLNAVYELIISREYLKGKGPRDTLLADQFGRKALARIDRLDDWEVKSEILLDASERQIRQGNRDSAYIYQTRYIAARDTYNTLRHPVEVSRIHNMREVSRIQAEKQKNRQLYITRILILSLIILLLIALTIYIEWYHRYRHRMDEQKHISENLKSELEIERYHRQFLAMSLAIEDTDRSFSEIRDRLQELQKEGKINDQELKQVEDVIKKHTIQRNDLNKFRELFEKTHPGFLKNLKAAWPDLSETQVRLATYIYTGMDNKQIANFLNIRVESVKQSRWRLRMKMGLQPGDSLEDTLRNL